MRHITEIRKKRLIIIVLFFIPYIIINRSLLAKLKKGISCYFHEIYTVEEVGLKNKIILEK